MKVLSVLWLNDSHAYLPEQNRRCQFVVVSFIGGGNHRPTASH